MKWSIGYITASKKEAHKITVTLLEEKLIACANVIDNATSYFTWDDRLNKTKESIILIKTKKNNLKKIIQRVKQMHSYDCPCIIFVPIKEGNPDFLKWIETNC